MNKLDRTDASIEGKESAWQALKRKARSMTSRHPMAKGGRGSAKPPGSEINIDSVPSKNSPQKALAPFLAPQHAPSGASVSAPGTNISSDNVPAPELIVPSEAVPVESKWRESGEYEVVIYARPLNQRMLLIKFDDQSHGKLIVSPRERAVFNVGQRVWVRPVERGVYGLAGRYNIRGRRVA